jgi:DNA-binding transcriptional LysR family regulator
MRYEHLKIHLDATEKLPIFNAKEMDILFGCAEICDGGDENLVRKKIGLSRYVLCASPKYLKRKGVPYSTAELLQHDFIAHGGRQIPEVITLDNSERIITKPKLIFNNTELILQAALSDLGFIWIDEEIAKNLINKKKLIVMLEQYTQETTNVYLFYEYQYKLDPKIRVFADYFFNM